MEEINQGYYFELMDRCHVQMESIGTFLLSNPHIQANEEQKKKLEQAISLIMDVYQWAGNKDHEESAGLLEKKTEADPHPVAFRWKDKRDKGEWACLPIRFFPTQKNENIQAIEMLYNHPPKQEKST